MDISGIQVKIFHGGFGNSLSMNKIISPLLENFDQTFIKEEFSFLENEKLNYSLVVNGRFIEFECTNFEDIIFLVDNLKLLNLEKLDLENVNIYITTNLSLDINDNLNYLFTNIIENIEVEFLGFKITSKNDIYKINLLNTEDDINVGILTVIDVQDVNNINKIIADIYPKLEEVVLPKIYTFLGR